jgi:hypothetical protein
MDNETDFTNALTDDKDFLNLMINIIRKEKLPVLVKNKTELKKELKNRG